jgi:Putative auto-transporter adhesin, head GIN domain
MNFKKLRQMNTIKGNADTGAKEEQVSSFIHLHISVNGKSKAQPVLIELHQSEDEEKVVFKTDKNLIKYLSAVNTGKTLFVSSDAGFRKLDYTQLAIKIYLRQIIKLNVCCENYQLICVDAITGSSPFNIKVQGAGKADLRLDAPVVKMNLQNQGDILIAGKCVEADIKTQLEGNLYARGFISQAMKLKNMSEGNMEVFAEESISIAHFGKGNIYYYGNAKLLNVNQSGEGFILHKKSIQKETAVL